MPPPRSSRSTSPPAAAPKPGRHRSDAREQAREAVAPDNTEAPDASLLETIGAAVSQPVRDAATSQSDARIKTRQAGRPAEKKADQR